MKEDIQLRRSGETNITGLSALGAVVVLALAGLSGCKSAPTRVAEFHDPFLPTKVVEASPASEKSPAQLATAEQPLSPAASESTMFKTVAREDPQFQLTGY